MKVHCVQRDFMEKMPRKSVFYQNVDNTKLSSQKIQNFQSFLLNHIHFRSSSKSKVFLCCSFHQTRSRGRMPSCATGRNAKDAGVRGAGAPQADFEFVILDENASDAEEKRLVSF